ncbi:hypothetical protein HYZ97_04950 [Candidatus Pacearchaeota archaeon]|nr:hypothetical protein [Candidatus Pacearchaeota archaeon]
MGGCYSSSYDYKSRCTEPVIPAWQTALKSALKNMDRTALTAAYKAFFASGRTGGGFIAEAAKLLDVSDVFNIPKELSEFEYEVKFDIQMHGTGKEPSITEFLNAFDFPVAAHARFLKDPVNTDAVGINHFYGTKDEERLVVIEKGGTHLKEKSEFLPLSTGVSYEHIVTKRRETRRPATLDEILIKVGTVMHDPGVSYQGKIRKEKGDAFILDAHDGRIYSFTITRAHLQQPGKRDENSVQRQLEIEYAGYLPKFLGFKKDSEQQIVAGMVDLARYTFALYCNAPVVNGWRIQLEPTHERKYDFVREKGNGKKQHKIKLKAGLEEPLALSA